MAMSGGSDDGSPMMEMNMTPLIDVLLVLLIMFIITIPVATHAINIDLPTPNPDRNQPIVDPIVNKVVISDIGEILWNGEVISQSGLAENLERSLQLPVEPELQFEPMANASYELSVNVLTIIKRSGVSKFGFAGNDRYRQFDCGGCPPINIGN